MRIGTSLTEADGPDALSALADEIRRAADDGFASGWISNIFGLEALTALAVAGHGVPGIELGTAVVPTYPRHPAVLAQQALTTALALEGRLALGIGLSHQIVIEDMYGYSFDKPARHMREYLSVLLPLLDGEQAGFDGETVHAHIGLSVPRPVSQTSRIPVLLAAMAPQMLRLAGERADGTVLWMTGPATVRDYVVPSITAAARNAGRPAPRVVCVAAGLRDRRRGRLAGRGGQDLRHLRPAAVLPGDAGQGGCGRAGRRGHHRRRGRRRGADLRAGRRGRDRLRGRRVRTRPG